MSGMFDSDYEANVKITNVNNFIKAIASGLLEVVKGTKEAINNGEPVVLEPGRIRPVEEPAQAEEAEPEQETVTVLKSDWDQLVKLAQLFREHPEATEGYKISVGADLAGTVCYVNEHIEK